MKKKKKEKSNANTRFASIAISKEAHQRVKDFCSAHGLKISHWLSELIKANV